MTQTKWFWRQMSSSDIGEEIAVADCSYEEYERLRSEGWVAYTPWED